jgi:hypothetical protein
MRMSNKELINTLEYATDTLKRHDRIVEWHAAFNAWAIEQDQANPTKDVGPKLADVLDKIEAEMRGLAHWADNLDLGDDDELQLAQSYADTAERLLKKHSPPGMAGQFR